MAKELRFNAPQQRVFDGIPIPLVLGATQSKSRSVNDVVTWVRQNQPKLEKALTQHGAILFKGFPLRDGHDMDAFVSAFKGWQPLSYEESLSFAVRISITDKVSTTNEGKAGGQVFHHEQAQTPVWPDRLFFFCVTPAELGGGTAISPSHVVLERLGARYPAFVSKLRKEGVRYTSIMTAGQDKTKGAGRGWKSYFSRPTKKACEQRMRELGYSWEWLDNDRLRAVSPVLAGVRTAPGTGREVFFNQLIAQAISNAKEFAGGEDTDEQTFLDGFMTFGDGSSMDLEILKYAHKLSEECAIELNWEAGDIVLIDNMQVMHARRAFEDDNRLVLASIFTTVGPKKSSL